MQTLYFEPAWDKTIAPADREKIVNHFNSQVTQLENGIHFLFLWEAFNHQGERLVTALIHNREDMPFRIQDTTIAFFKRNKQIANGLFHIPCEIQGKTSMPWTFIFSSINQTSKIPDHKIVH